MSTQLTLLIKKKQFVLYILFTVLVACKAPKSMEQDVIKHKEVKKVSTSTSKTKDLSWLFVGDSLTAGFGVTLDQSYVSVLQQKLKSELWVDPQSQRVPQLVNAGVSGDTSAGVLRRIDWLLTDKPDRVFICIGANDGLRGQSLTALEANLKKIIHKIKRMGIYVHLIGMKLPPNYGADYTVQFEQVYQKIARSEKVPFYPFLLEGVAGNIKYNQTDGIHPNEEGHQKVAEEVLSHLVTMKLLQKEETK